MSSYLLAVLAVTSLFLATSTDCIHDAACPQSADEGLSFVQLRSQASLEEKRQEPGVLPPVHGDVSEEDAKKLGTISVTGSWGPYYEKAEASMESQWNNFLLPMIRSSDFSSVLEVAAGACRNTAKLYPLAQNLIATDIDVTAVNSCKDRFATSMVPGKNLSFSVVDGAHLPVPDGSISFVYQFDSGVHFHRNVIRQYLLEFQRVLRPGGTGFFHHSNLAASQFPVNDDEDVTKNAAWRSNMSKALFDQYAQEAGLEVVCHPLVDWAGNQNLDSFARFVKPGGVTDTKALDADMCPTHITVGALEGTGAEDKLEFDRSQQ